MYRNDSGCNFAVSKKITDNTTDMTETEFLRHTAGGNPVEAGSPGHLLMHSLSQRALRITAEINGAYHEPDELRRLMSELTGRELDDSFGLFPPFHTDCGRNISIGARSFINMGCTFQDWGGIEIGDDCLIGHNCTICTVNHSKHPDRSADMTFAPVRIADKVWIGANVTILPGVTIGEGTIVAAGAIVTKDVEPESIAAGIPARTIKRLCSS